MAHTPKLTEGETVIVDTRTHWKAILWPAVVLVVTVAVAVYLTTLVGNTYVRWFVWIVAVAVLVVWSVKPFLEWLTATYTITTKRLITREGLIARRGHDIPLLRISDASTHGSVELHDIPDVEDVQHQLMDLLGGLHRDSGRTDDA